MSWHRRRTTLYVVLAGGLFSLSLAACDDDLGFGDDDDADYDENNDENSDAVAISSSSSGGGGTRPSGGTSTWPVADWETEAEHAHDSEDPDATPIDDIDVAVVDNSDRPSVSVETGELEGRWVGGRIRRFLGIPYAEPPIGDLRFASPRDAESWRGVRDTSEYGPRCAQSASSAFSSDPSVDEDCLYLNVWSPNVRSGRQLPVIVFLHGGEHAYGSASESGPDGRPAAYYDGTRLADRGVVVVSLNYRLGPLGFFAHPALEDDDIKSGNQGLLDQQLALIWVKHNIENFGGDPRNVTLIGQGSGATDVCLHVVSPSSQTLFTQAVSQSGGCTTYQPEARNVARATADWVADVGCDTRDVIDCLRDKPVKELLAKVPAYNSPFVPIVDGDFLPKQPRALYAEGGYAFPYIVGSNSYEGSWLSWELSDITSEAAYHQYLKNHYPDVSLEKLCELYPHDEFGTTPTAYQRSLARLLGDARYRCAVADTALRASDAGADVYVYNFDVSPDAEGIGPTHGAELGYVFGTASGLSSDEKQVSTLMQKYWTNLGRYRDPNDYDDGDLLEWPTIYDEDARLNIALQPKIVRDFDSNECGFWRDVYAEQFDIPE